MTLSLHHISLQSGVIKLTFRPKQIVRFLSVAAIFYASASAAPAGDEELVGEETEPRYLWLVTIDGLRPQELFTGADRRLIDKEVGGVVDSAATLAQFWHSDTAKRREKLMPFFWRVVAKQGQVFGNA